MAACGGYGWVLMTRRRWGFEQVALDDHVSVGRDTEKVRRRHKDLDSFLSSSAQLRKYTSIQIHPSIPNLASNPSGKSSVYSVLHLIPSHVALQLESLSRSARFSSLPPASAQTGMDLLALARHQPVHSTLNSAYPLTPSLSCFYSLIHLLPT